MSFVQVCTKKLDIYKLQLNNLNRFIYVFNLISDPSISPEIKDIIHIAQLTAKAYCKQAEENNKQNEEAGPESGRPQAVTEAHYQVPSTSGRDPESGCSSKKKGKTLVETSLIRSAEEGEGKESNSEESSESARTSTGSLSSQASTSSSRSRCTESSVECQILDETTAEHMVRQALKRIRQKEKKSLRDEIIARVKRTGLENNKELVDYVQSEYGYTVPTEQFLDGNPRLPEPPVNHFLYKICLEPGCYYTESRNSKNFSLHYKMKHPDVTDTYNPGVWVYMDGAQMLARKRLMQEASAVKKCESRQKAKEVIEEQQAKDIKNLKMEVERMKKDNRKLAKKLAKRKRSNAKKTRKHRKRH